MTGPRVLEFPWAPRNPPRQGVPKRSPSDASRHDSVVGDLNMSSLGVCGRRFFRSEAMSQSCSLMTRRRASASVFTRLVLLFVIATQVGFRRVSVRWETRGSQSVEKPCHSRDNFGVHAVEIPGTQNREWKISEYYIPTCQKTWKKNVWSKAEKELARSSSGPGLKDYYSKCPACGEPLVQDVANPTKKCQRRTAAAETKPDEHCAECVRCENDKCNYQVCECCTVSSLGADGPIAKLSLMGELNVKTDGCGGFKSEFIAELKKHALLSGMDANEKFFKPTKGDSCKIQGQPPNHVFF